MEERTDAQLVQAYLSGDEESLGVLFTRHLKGAYAYIVRLIGPNEADDAVQEGFVKAWRSLSTYDQTRVFRPWLYRIIHNAALDLLKKNRSKTFTELGSDDGPALEEVIEDPSPLPSEVLECTLSTNELKKLIDALPLKQRTVLLLYYEDDMTFAEIGSVLDEPLNTVKSRHYRAVQTLREAIERLPHQKDGTSRISP